MLGSGFVIVGIKRRFHSVNAGGFLGDGVEPEEGVGDAGLSEVELADLGGDVVSEDGGGSDGGEDVVGVGSDDGEDLSGFEERGEVVVEGRALGEEGFEVHVEGPLVGDAFVEETSHCAHVGEGAYLG